MNKLSLTHLGARPFHVEDHAYYYFDPQEQHEQYTPTPETTYGYLVNDYGVLTVSGHDATTFLQGQLSIDVSRSEVSSIGCCCNREGRVISLFFYLKHNDEHHLVMPLSILETTTKHLKKYARFSKVTFTISTCLLLALPSLQAKALVNNSFYPYIELKFGSLLMLKGETSLQTIQKIKQTSSISFNGNYQWQRWLLQHFLPQLTATTQGKFLPHDLGLHRIGALDFQKGCYLGQEIIARIHYRAKLKNQLALLLMPKKYRPGDELFHENKPIGHVVDALPLNVNETICLSSVRETALPALNSFIIKQA